MEYIITLFVVGMVWVLPVYLCVLWAGAKNRSKMTWALLGFLLGWLGLILLALHPKK